MDEEQRKLAEELLASDEKNISFAKQLFLGRYAEDILPDYPKESDGEYLDQVTKFAKETIDADWIDRHAMIPEIVVKGLGQLGVFGMTVPHDYGGLGMGQVSYCRLTERLASICASTTLLINVHQSIGLRGLLLFGTDAQKSQWLPILASGEKLAAFSLTEPTAGSDASGVKTRAIYDEEKKCYRITGQKQWSTNGSLAGMLTVMARTEDDKITAFLVTPDMPGFKVTESSLEKVGFRGTWTANLAFENMEVPEENILGPKGKGLKVALTVLDYGRTTFGALCTGVAKDLIVRARIHATSRMQFKRPLASFGLVKEKIARIESLTYAMESTTYLVASILDKGSHDVMLESAMLKVFASEALWEIIYETMQIYGGRSFFTSEPLERMMRDARLNMIGEGANEVMRAFIGAVGLREMGTQLPKLLGALFAPSVNSPFKKEAKQLSKMIRRFSFGSFKALVRHREQVVEQQLVLDRLATAAMALFTCTAVLRRPPLTPVDERLAKFYCQTALKKADHVLRHLLSKDDATIYSVADQITGL